MEQAAPIIEDGSGDHLEALLSAREHLLITYVGRSITDNAELPPSVVVSELLDAIDATARAIAPAGRHSAADDRPQLQVRPVRQCGPARYADSGRTDAGAVRQQPRAHDLQQGHRCCGRLPQRHAQHVLRERERRTVDL
jgi:hypothetical protein